MISQKAAMLDFRLNLYENFKTMGHYSGAYEAAKILMKTARQEFNRLKPLKAKPD